MYGTCGSALNNTPCPALNLVLGVRRRDGCYNARRGTNFGSIHTRGVDREVVRRVLPEIGKKHSCVFLLAPEIDGWIAIYPSDCGQDAEVSAEIAGRLKTAVLHVILHDDDLFNYTFHSKGRLVDEFSSKPDYFGKVTEARRQALAGKPEVTCPQPAPRAGKMFPGYWPALRRSWAT